MTIQKEFTIDNCVTAFSMDKTTKTKAVFVGEETEGKPNHFGEIKMMTLPNSGLIIQYSTHYFKNSAIDMNTISPDKTTESSFQDFRKGIDPAFEWIRKQ